MKSLNKTIGGGTLLKPKSSKYTTTGETTLTDILTSIGLFVSITFLCLHLVAFALVDGLRNLPGKNLASFCAALLLEYSSTLLSSMLQGNACYINEIAAYYFIMSSAFWMLTMSYDVWQTVRTSTTPTSSGQCKKFIIYSIWSWITPAVLTILVFQILPNIVPDFNLKFIKERCSFLQTKMMYIFIESIFGTICVINTSFFASSVHYIYSTQNAVRKYSNNNAAFINHFRLYGRLAIIMGVTWTAEFIIYYSDFDILSTTFRIINTFEGLFIVIAFTCRKDVFDSLNSSSLRSLPYYNYITFRRV